jgi:hypothetical protein
MSAVPEGHCNRRPVVRTRHAPPDLVEAWVTCLVCGQRGEPGLDVVGGGAIPEAIDNWNAGRSS